MREEIFSREDTPTDQRVEMAFLYHAGLSYRRVERGVGRLHEDVRQWYHRLAHLFDPDPDYHATVAVDEPKVSVEDDEVYVWAAVDVDTFEVVHIEVSPGRSDFDVLLFLKPMLTRCRGQPEIVVDRGPWDNWALDDPKVP
jgi:putative transposase